MKPIFLSLLLCTFGISCTPTKPSVDEKLRACPEKYFEDRMPRIIDPENPDKMPRAYFIYKGQRREISEFDTSWVWKNCAVEKQIVY